MKKNMIYAYLTALCLCLPTQSIADEPKKCMRASISAPKKAEIKVSITNCHNVKIPVTVDAGEVKDDIEFNPYATHLGGALFKSGSTLAISRTSFPAEKVIKELTPGDIDKTKGMIKIECRFTGAAYRCDCKENCK